jgi:hypothetical protein
MRPDLQQIHAAARRERALAMHRLIFAPIAGWFRSPRKVRAPRPLSRSRNLAEV